MSQRIIPDRRAVAALRRMDPRLDCRWDPSSGCLCVFQQTGSRRTTSAPERLLWEIRDEEGNPRQLRIADIKRFREQSINRGPTYEEIKAAQREAEAASQAYVAQECEGQRRQSALTRLKASGQRNDSSRPFFDLGAR